VPYPLFGLNKESPSLWDDGQGASLIDVDCVDQEGE
jgi:hypothetical protein